LFSRSKDERDITSATPATKTGVETKMNGTTPARASSTDGVSKLGAGMVITGNIMCDGALQIFGHVLGDIHASQLAIGQGAHVEGNVVAQDTTIDGFFKGTIHSNTVKLQGSAVVEGEIFNKSLNIQENAQFEGVSRRLDKPVEPPPVANLVPQPGQMGFTS
jgi:cytoskeletal protein CcmA (bactofilin family)